MNPNIKAAVKICPRLSVKVNIGNRHRIMRTNGQLDNTDGVFVPYKFVEILILIVKPRTKI